ncbi:ABC transporter permease OS=Streptomyces microflavus OX=1919 GN=ssuC_2 PE=3 SV=1 [Streptomyces microflavus]
MSESALAKRPAEPAGVARRAGPTAGERLARAAEQSWRPVALLLGCFALWWAIAAAELVEP